MSARDDVPDLAGAIRSTAIRSVIDTLFDPLVLLAAVRDGEGRIIDFEYLEANAAACRFEGLDREQVVGARMLDLHPGNLSAGTFDRYVRVLESGEPFMVDDVVYEVEGAGRTRVFDVRAVRAGSLVSLTWRDVTERHDRIRRLAVSEERYRLLAENSSDVVMLTKENTVTWVSAALERTLGWTPEEWMDQSLSIFGVPEDYPIVLRAMQRMASGERVVLRVRLFDKERVPHWVELHSQTYLNIDGMPDGVLSSFRTVDDEVASAEALKRQARFDALTGLPNRADIVDRIAGAGARRRRPSAQFAVLFCDVDRFKDINDAYGHAGGDEVLRLLAMRFSSAVRHEDRVARFGGDEFVILLDGVHRLEEAMDIAEKIRAVACEPVRHENVSIPCSVSIGVTIGRSGEDVHGILRRADVAMYEAKRDGRNRVITIDGSTIDTSKADQP